MNRSTKVLSASENLRVPLTRGNALLVEVVGTGTGSVDLKSAVDGANWTNHPYVQSRAAAPTRSVAQITSMTRTQYVMLPPLTDARIDVVVTTGTITITYREIEYAGLASAGGNVATDTIFDAKGDLAVGTGSDTASRLAVGSNDQILMADSGEATGLKWVSPTTTPAAVGTQAGGTGDTFARGDHVHATGAGTPSTQAFGDAAAVGTGPAAAMTDHKHAMPADPVTAHAAAADPHTDYLKESVATTKGDIFAATASSTITRLAVSATNGAGLVVDSAETTGLKWSVAGIPVVVALTDGANIATNAALGNVFTVTLAGNRTMDAPTNPVNGQVIIYHIRQDGSGNRTITWDSAFRGNATRALPTLTTTASRKDSITFQYDSTDSKWDLINTNLNYA